MISRIFQSNIKVEMSHVFEKGSTFFFFGWFFCPSFICTKTGFGSDTRFPCMVALRIYWHVEGAGSVSFPSRFSHPSLSLVISLHLTG